MNMEISRTLIAAVVGLIVVLFGQRAGMTPDQITEAVYVIISYILGRAVQKGLTEGARG